MLSEMICCCKNEGHAMEMMWRNHIVFRCFCFLSVQLRSSSVALVFGIVVVGGAGGVCGCRCPSVLVLVMLYEV